MYRRIERAQAKQAEKLGIRPKIKTDKKHRKRAHKNSVYANSWEKFLRYGVKDTPENRKLYDENRGYHRTEDFDWMLELMSTAESDYSD